MSLTEMRDCRLSLLTNFSTFLTRISPNSSAEPQRIRVRAYGFGYLDYDKQHSGIPTNSAISDLLSPLAPQIPDQNLCSY